MHPFYGPSSQLITEGNAWWLGLLSMAMYLLFWAVVIYFAFRLFRKYFPLLSHLSQLSQLSQFSHRQPAEDTAMTILRERYARGEIDAEEFKRKKADLEDSAGSKQAGP